MFSHFSSTEHYLHIRELLYAQFMACLEAQAHELLPLRPLQASFMCKMCTIPTLSLTEPSKFLLSSLSLCDTVAYGEGLLIKLKLIALPSGSCMASLFTLYHTLLLRLSGEKETCFWLKRLDFVQENLVDVHLQNCLCLRPGSQALLCSVTGGWTLPILNPVTVGSCGGKPQLKASLLASNTQLLPSSLCEKKT